MTKERVDLVNIFQEVTQTLAQNQQNLNRADEFNQDHGTNMVQTFTTITKAVQSQKKKGASDSAALAYAAKKLSSSSTSSSGQQYARNLSTAATQFKGKQVDQRGAMDLLMTLIGGGAATQPTSQATSQTPKPTSSGGDLLGGLVGTMMGGGSSESQEPTTSGGGDMLSSLLGGMMGGGESTSQPSSTGGGDLLSSLLGGALGGGTPQTSQQSSGGGDILSSLLGGALGGGSTSQQAQTSQGDGKIGLDDILQAAMAYFQAKQSGQGNLQAIIQAVTAASRMGDTVHRQQSTEMVASSFLQAVASTSKK